MASKGKDKIKVKKHEVEFNKKRIDLKRFAYDVMKYTALKFRVPESCIAVWEGSANDYGHDDFCLVVCRKIILCQLAERYRYHTSFREHYERNKLATPELIGRLLLEVINKEMEIAPMPPLVKIGVSLAVLCELFLFLYSEDINPCPKQLATHWFQSYLSINKKKFENAGGFEQMYLNGSIKQFDDVDDFINKFIEDHCFPYKTTASNPDIAELFNRSFQKRIPESAKSFSEKDAEKIEETVKSVTEMLKRQHLDIEIEEVVVVPIPAPDEASGTNVPQNIDFEIIPHNMLLQLVDPSVASPQDPSAASPGGKPRQRRRLSYKQRIEKEIEASEVDLLSNPGLGVPLPHEMYDFPFSVDAAQSQKLPEESVQELPKHTKESSHRERSRKPSSRASVEQGFGQPSSDSSETKKPIVTRTPPKGPSASSPELLQHHGTSSYNQRMKMIKSGLRVSVEQGLGQLSSDAYEMKQSSRKSPSVSRTLPSQDPSATSPEDQPQCPRILTDEEILKILSTSDDESSLTSKREETLGIDLPSNPGLGVPLPHQMYDFLLADVVELSKNLTEQSVQEPSKHARSSHRERDRKPSLRASVDQGLAQPSSDSSETKRPIFTRTVASPKDPSATSPEQPQRPRIGDEEIAKILSMCEEESLTSKRGETSEVDLPSISGLGVPLPYEIYEFPFSVDAAQSQKLPEENVQELSKHTKASHRERSWKPSSRASVEQGLEQPSSDSSEMKSLFVTKTVTSSKGPSASSPEEPQHRRTLSYKERMKMIKSGLRASVEQDLGQPSSDSSETKKPIVTRTLPKGPSASSPEEQPQHHGTLSYKQRMKSGLRVNVEQGLGQLSSDAYEMEQSSKKTASVPRTLVPSQDPSATSPEEQPRRPRNLTDEQIAKILRNLTDEEIAKLLSISEEESPLTSKRDKTSEVDLPSNPDLVVPLPQEMHDFPLADVAELSQKLPEERAQETPKHATRLSQRTIISRDGKPSLRAGVEQGLEQPRSDSSKTKKPIVTRTVASPKGPSASSPEEQPQRHRTLSYKQRMEMIKSGLRASVKPGFGQASLVSSMATDTMQSYELQGARPRVPKQKTGSSGLQTGESSSPKTRVKNTGSSGLQKIKSKGEKRKEIEEE